MGSSSLRSLTGLFLVLFFLICSGSAHAESAPAQALIPEPLLHIADGSAIIVEKDTHRLYYYEGGKLVKSIRVTTGKRRGDKLVEEDKKTPEGIYFLKKFLEDKELPAKYGARAITLDYPNPIDKFQGKTGFGIWIHGTNVPSRLERPYDSRGCVVMLNNDVLELAEMITLNSTPVIIVKKLNMLSQAESKKELRKIGRWFKESFEFGFDSVEELMVIKFDTYNVVSFVMTKERRVVYFKEKEGGFEVAAAAYENRATTENATSRQW